jgi:hypothetical protein
MNLNGLLGSLLSPTSGQGAPLATPPKAAPKETEGADASAGVMAQISDAAKAMFAQMKRDGVSDESFDLHLDLRQLGLKVSANGARSVEGHSLSVDLHVEAHQGTAKTDNGDVSFQSLDVSFSLQETWVKASQAPQQDGQAQSGQPDQTQPGQAGQAQAAKPQQSAGGIVDGLKKLIDLLHQTDGQPGQDDGLGAILAQIGRALEAMAKRVSDAKDTKPKDQPQTQLEGVQLQEDVHVHALHVEMAAVQDAQGQTA